MKHLLFVAAAILVLSVGCKKSKIEKNLDGSWSLSEFIIDGYNEVTANTSHTIKFSGVDKGEGTVQFIAVDAQGTYYTNGTVTLNKDYDQMTINLVDGTYTINMEGSFDVDESSFEMIGTFSNNAGDSGLGLSIKGFK